MLALHELQQLFVRGLQDESDDILSCIKSDAKLSAQNHLEIYRSSIIGAKQKVLTEIFPVCHNLVGKDFFLAMANAYIAEYHSLSPDLGNYGLFFPIFVQHFPPAKKLPYLADVAKLEWAWHKIFSSADNPVLNFQNLAECFSAECGNITFSLPNDSFLIESVYPIQRIWEVNQEDYRGDQTVMLTENDKYYFLVWRDKLVMRIDELNADEWQVLSWMHTGFTIDTICEHANTLLPHLDLIELLPRLIKRGWLVDFKLI